MSGNWSAKRFGIIQWTIVFAAVLSLVYAWPAEFGRKTFVSECGEFYGGSSVLSEDHLLQQQFIPRHDNLREIYFYVENERETVDTMQVVFRIYDSTGDVILEYIFDLEDYEFPGWISVPVDVDLVPGAGYVYTVGGLDGELVVAYVDKENKSEESEKLYYQGIESPNAVAATQYGYITKWETRDVVRHYCITISVAVILLFLTLVIRKKYKIVMEKVLKGILLGGCAALAVISFIAIVIQKVFTDDPLNVIVLFVGVLGALVLLGVKIIFCRPDSAPLKPGEYNLGEKLVHFTRAFLLALMFWMSFVYTNGTSNVVKFQYSKLILVFGVLFLVSLGKRKQIFHIPAAVWSLLAVGIGICHVHMHGETEVSTKYAVREAWVIWAVGLLILHLIYRIKDGEWRRLRRLNVPYAVCALLFFVLSVIFQNGRFWTVVAFIFFLVWSVVYLMTDDREKIWEDLCNGILLAFAGGILYCLCRRPYQYYMMSRYGGIFHTVTITAYYYSAVIAAAFVKIMAAYREKNGKKVLSAWCVLGSVLAYLVFTASRTGVFAAFVVGIFAIVLAWKKEGRFFGSRVKKCVIMISTAGMMLVTCFSLTRILPAMVHNPYYFDVEEEAAFIMPDTPLAGGDRLGERYMDVQRMFQMLYGRLVKSDLSPTTVRDDSGVSSGKYRLGRLMVSTDAGAVAKNLEAPQYDNGRMQIYKDYGRQLNMAGHSEMALIDENGSEKHEHAHNSYLQVAHDFGIPTGIVFLAFCFMTFWYTLRKAWKNRKKNVYVCLPLLVTVAFSVSSLVEWIYHPYNPLGIVFFCILPVCVAQDKITRKKLEEEI